MRSHDTQRPGWNKRLLASTRGRILTLLRTEDRTVSDLAAILKLTANAVRAHLLSLERDELVQQHGTRPGTRKPHTAYKLSADAEYVFPKAYGPLLNHLVSAISTRVAPGVLRATMYAVGRMAAEDHVIRFKGKSRRDRVKVALDVLNDLGGSPIFDEQEGKQFIYGRNGCPLAAVTATHPLACLIIESMLSKIIGVPAKKCCEYGDTPRCCFQLQR
jgi:predicted ArsR family transcriptional regulator